MSEKKLQQNNVFSIIIPAHNEEKVISRCLTSLRQGLNSKEAKIIVVCNGCTDQTATLVQSISREIELLDTPLASKTNALNLGDEHAKGFPRVYMDADILIRGEDVKKLVEELKKNSLQIVYPAMRIDLKKAPWAIKAYYKIWCSLPFVTQGATCGVSVVSEAGRKRFDKFPEITADDSYVRSLFSPSERGLVKSAVVTIFPPRLFWDLMRMRTRQYFGAYELKMTFPEMVNQYPERNIEGTFFSLFKKIHLWPDLFVYIAVSFFTHIGGKCKFWFGDRQHWNRDESSRI